MKLSRRNFLALLGATALTPLVAKAAAPAPSWRFGQCWIEVNSVVASERWYTAVLSPPDEPTVTELIDAATYGAKLLQGEIGSWNGMRYITPIDDLAFNIVSRGTDQHGNPIFDGVLR